jgi:hypothetical protein
MNIVIITDYDTNQCKDLLVETIKSLNKYKSYVIGYFAPQILKQVTQLSRVTAYPKSTSMGYLKLFIEDDNLKDYEMVTLIKSGTLLISNTLDLNSDGHVGIQYVGSEQCTVDTVHDYIEKNDLKCTPGFSGTAIRVGFLREFFKHYELNETQLLQFIEELTNVSFLTSPNVYSASENKPLIPIDNHFNVKSHHIMEKYELTEQIIEKLKNFSNMIDSLEETQKDMIIAYKEKREYNVSLRSNVFDKLTSEIDQVFEILVENDLI